MARNIWEKQNMQNLMNSWEQNEQNSYQQTDDSNPDPAKPKNTMYNWNGMFSTPPSTAYPGGKPEWKPSSKTYGYPVNNPTNPMTPPGTIAYASYNFGTGNQDNLLNPISPSAPSGTVFYSSYNFGTGSQDDLLNPISPLAPSGPPTPYSPGTQTQQVDEQKIMTEIERMKQLIAERQQMLKTLQTRRRYAKRPISRGF